MKKNILLFFVFFLLFVLVLLNRRYVYMVIQHSGLMLGLNFNNLSKNSYVQFIKSQTDDFTDSKDVVFLNKNIIFHDIVSQMASNLVLGESTDIKQKSIDINLHDQKLFLKENDTIVGEYSMSSGKWAPTPTGSWQVWYKLRYSHIKGGSKVFGTYYDLPNVPYNLYFNQGYAIEGAYWIDKFGYPQTEGSIVMKPEEAGIVYNWADIGTKVTVHN